MSTDVPVDVASAPRWPRPLLFVAAMALLLASATVSAVQKVGLAGMAISEMPPDAIARSYPNSYYFASLVFAIGEVLLPVLLLCGLFVARRGVERGLRLETGGLPGLIVFGVLMFVTGVTQSLPAAWPLFPRTTQNLLFATRQATGFGHSGYVAVDAPTVALLLLACFAVVRADPPAPSRTGFGWTLAAGLFGGWCLWGEPDAMGSVGALPLYVWWSAGWRRALGFLLGTVVALGVGFSHMARSDALASIPGPAGRNGVVYAAAFVLAALLGYGLKRWMPGGPSPLQAIETPTIQPTATPTVPATASLPIASSHRVIGFLFFVGLMGAPTTMIEFAPPAWVNQRGGFFLLPSSLAAGLVLMDWLERTGRIQRRVAQIILLMAVLAILVWSALYCYRKFHMKEDSY